MSAEQFGIPLIERRPIQSHRSSKGLPRPDQTANERCLPGSARADNRRAGAGFPDGFNSGEPQRSGSFAHTFATPGSYDYVCTLHPQMTGRVVVTPKQ